MLCHEVIFEPTRITWLPRPWYYARTFTLRQPLDLENTPTPMAKLSFQVTRQKDIDEINACLRPGATLDQTVGRLFLAGITPANTHPTIRMGANISFGVPEPSGLTATLIIAGLTLALSLALLFGLYTAGLPGTWPLFWASIAAPVISAALLLAADYVHSRMAFLGGDA